MNSTRKFTLVLLIGFGFLIIGLSILSVEYSLIASQFMANPNAIVPACNPGSASGCVVWPYIDIAVVIVGLMMTLAGAIGLFEIRFPRSDV